MSIVLKENEWAENMIRKRSIGRKPSETLRRVFRYYIDNGYSKKEARKCLDSFLIQCEPTASLPKWSDTLDYAANMALKYKAIDIDRIDVTKPEMTKIDSLDGRLIKRLAFTLLCLAKYWMIVMPHGSYWVNSKDSQIMSLANIDTSIKRQCAMYWTLHENGMIQFSRQVDNTNVRVCFAEDGDPVMHITDFRNLGYQYLKYHGEPYFECELCGLTTKIKSPLNGRKPKYCNECAIALRTQRQVNSVMKNRRAAIERPNARLGVYTVYMHQSPNKKRYVGTTSTSLYERWKNGTGYIDNKHFYADITKFGWENIKHYKIATVQDIELARNIESCYIQKYKTAIPKNGYNRVSDKSTHRYEAHIIEQYSPIEVDEKGKQLT